jgi:hypothetical protein
MVIGLRSALYSTGDRSNAAQEDDMGRNRIDLMAANAVTAESLAGLEPPAPTVPSVPPVTEQLIFTGSTDWSPDQAEHYIDWRIQQIDTEISRLRQQLDDLIASRKRWLAVTGGRSKMFATNGNGNGNGHGPTNPS